MASLSGAQKTVIFIQQQGSEGMSCSADSLRTFLQLSRAPTDTERDKLNANTYPFTISFGPSTVIPTFNKNMITDTQNDTLLYRGNRYQLINIQICQPTHKGYTALKKTLVAEIVLTYTNFLMTDTYPSVILAIVPIYEGAIPDHGAYLQQFIDSTGQATSPQALFYEDDKDKTATSYGYKCCFQAQSTEDSKKTITYNTGIYYFVRGTTLVPQSIQLFKNLIARQNPEQPNYGIMPFEFLPYHRGRYSKTYLAANRWDPNGALPTQQVTPTDEIFTNRVQYMTQPPFRSGNQQDTCPYKKVSDYKCYPFSELNNVTKDASGSQIVVPLGDAMKDSTQTSSGSIDWLFLLVYIIVPVALLLGLVILIAVALLVTNQISNPGFPPGTASTSGMAAKMAKAVTSASA
jgi:hypothetical protein